MKKSAVTPLATARERRSGEIRDAMPKLSIFISSPGDVNEERVLAGRVIDRLQGEFGRHVVLEPIFWEHEPLLASDSFQHQIVSPADTDITVCIIWSRLGSRLPPEFVRDDKTRYASGTEFEFEMALKGFAERGKPALVVYRKTAEPIVSLKDRKKRAEQWNQIEALDGFIDKWFHHSEDRSLVAAFHEFERSSEFEETLEAHLRKLITKQLPEGEGNSEPPSVRPTWTEQSPFRGLEAFDVEHAPIFFGRTRAIGDVTSALRKQAAAGRAIVLVMGTSGIGKSSLIRAGIVPMLLQPGVMEGVGLARWAIVRPGDDARGPFHSLASALLSDHAIPELRFDQSQVSMLAKQLGHPAKVREILKTGLETAARELKDTMKLDRAPKARLVLVVDQLEELFTHQEISDGQKQAFVHTLATLAKAGSVWLIASMRADFYHRCSDYPTLLSLVEGTGQYLLAAPTPPEIGQMIRLPAVAAGLRFEEDPETGARLDDVLRDAAGQHPESVPLLEFTLEELFQRREGDSLTFAAYRELGGLEGALANRAQGVFESLSANEKDAAPSLFRMLTTLSSDDRETVTAHRAPVAQLETDETRKRVLHAFVDARLLVMGQYGDGESTARVAHEALLTHWAELRRWLDTEREFMRVRTRVASSAKNWMAEHKAAERLLPEGKPLIEAQDLLERRDELNTEIIEFIETSALAARRRQEAIEAAARQKLRRARALAAVLLVLSVGAIAGGVLGYLGQEAARKREAEARRTQSLFLSDLSRQETEAGNAVNGMLLALGALPEDLTQQDRPYVGEAEATLYQATSIQRELAVLPRVTDDDHRIGHTGWVNSTAFSPDGRLLASGSDDGTVRLWETRDFKQIAVLRSTTAPRMTGNEREASTEDFEESEFNAIAFSPDGKFLVTGSANNQAALWNVRSGKRIALLEGHTKPVEAVEFSADGAIIATGSTDKTVRLWHLGSEKTTGLPDARTVSVKEAGLLGAHKKAIQSLAFSPDGSYLATGAADRQILLWDLRALPNLPEPVAIKTKSSVLALAFSPDGQTLASGSGNVVELRRLADTGRVKKLLGHEKAVKSIAFSPDGTRIASASNDKSIRLWDAKKEEEIATLLGHEEGVLSVSFSPDGTQIVSGARDLSVRIWDARTNPRLTLFDVPGGDLLHAAFSSDGTYIVTSSIDGVARIRLAQEGTQFLELHGHVLDRAINEANFSADGQHVVTASEDGTARIWDALTGHTIKTLVGHELGVTAASFGPDDTTVTVLTASKDGTARIWDAATGESKITLTTSSGQWMTAARFSPDGQLVATASNDAKVLLWDVTTGEQIRALEGHEAEIRSLRFSRDGRRLVTASNDRTARIWRVETGEELLVLQADDNKVLDAAFSPDGERVVTASFRKKARLWNARTGDMITVLDNDGSVTAVEFSPDGAWIMAASAARGNSNVRLWPTFGTTAALIEHAKRSVPRELTKEQERKYFLVSE